MFDTLEQAVKKLIVADERDPEPGDMVLELTGKRWESRYDEEFEIPIQLQLDFD
jgi:hypothetical protein